MFDPQFTLIDNVRPPDSEFGPDAHVLDYEIQKLLSQGWQRYVTHIREQVGDIPAPVVKQITTTFEAECYSGDPLRRGVKAASRSRRSYVLEEALWNSDTHVLIATSRVVMTGIDRTTGRAAEIPQNMWDAVETLEQRRIAPPPPAGSSPSE